MPVRVVTRDDVVIIGVQGRLDAVTAPAFDREVESVLADTPTKVLIDGTGLDYISSAGLRSILALAKKLQAGGGRLALCGLSGLVREIFEMAGLHTMLTICRDEAEARSRL
ncbi:STAS domain-containing protein [Desulfofustis limnaeus]|jgi:anti-anti-sigma factor|uniref:Anti-sigma factor antagonist n=1 Tax=Desulfofustis limnaeus TaxID=2740163 RepID=A0ABM7WBA7_9BACT|nr:STAS domain-containing protein [Desulfofustis limnaeus]MDX9894235.1 STAS domain-containing protein [Desulfofustis sp.]BDD88255.1 anti-sigma factor antagonist [Desulfofustis limnaeus]